MLLALAFIQLFLRSKTEKEIFLIRQINSFLKINSSRNLFWMKIFVRNSPRFVSEDLLIFRISINQPLVNFYSNFLNLFCELLLNSQGVFFLEQFHWKFTEIDLGNFKLK